ncbi:hypothetical protein EJ02DRAFT_130800 [Clathrospora elynae]|uniref:SWI/SNF family DNA-dependent ATPase Ris1 n=1 Tax=Clathrospora elynae TaxID=706981 RepID=A0A6A5SUJ1_9PLEO|nr:hypothetical protein EJ02DRAFT_130800 [Clathrospora elynae]
MATQNTNSPLQTQANITLVLQLLVKDHRHGGCAPAERPYYEGLLGDLYEQQAQQQREQSFKAMAGPSGTYIAPHGVQVPSPPLAEPSPPTRKRSLGPAEFPQAKRVSAQPSPDTPGTPISPQWTLPSRQSKPPTFIDLTESDPPSPEPVLDLFHYPFPIVNSQSFPVVNNQSFPVVNNQSFPVVNNQMFPQVNNDPFAELNYVYRGDYSTLAPVDAFNQDFMSQSELAQFMLTPSRPGGGYGFQQYQPLPFGEPQFDFATREVPYLRNAQDGSDSEDYGALPMNGAEADVIEKLFENIKDHGETPEGREPTPAMMTCNLKEYQRIGLTWLLKMERGHIGGGILADEMGLGKTVQALSLICANPPTNPLRKTTLIIAPVALMRQWESEIERHIQPRHKLKVYLYHGNGKNADFARLRQYDVVLTTFGSLTSEYKQKEDRKESMLHEQEMRDHTFRRKPKDRLALLGHDCFWYRVIIDEAHTIKNRNAKSSKAAADLMAQHRLCLTGTPMMNSVDELYSLLRFLKMDPYQDWPRFNAEIGKPVKHKDESMRKKGMNRLQIVLKSIMLRRQKESKVDGEVICTIPPKHTGIDNVDFSDEELALYNALQTKSQIQMNKYLEKGAVSANYASVLVLLLRLRQACCHPHLIKDLSQAATEGIAEVDLLTRAEELNEDVINRLKAFDGFECPICLEADPNPTIIIPCGHTVCGECVQKLIDPAMRAQQDGNNEASTAKCPHCRGELKAKFITDYKHFCKVHCPDRLDSSDEADENEQGDVSDVDSDSDSDVDDVPDVDKKGNLADFVVDDEDEFESEANDNDDDVDLGSALEPGAKPAGKKSKKRSKGKGKARAQPKLTLAQLKKESLRNKSAKKRYLRRLDKTYVPSAKIDKTVELLEEFRRNDPTEKTLIFSQFTSLLDLVEVPLYRKKIRYQRYDGSMKMDERADAVNAFMDDPNENVMLVSIKAGNAGLNLWKASRVIILDPFWNPFIEEQAIDRAHRMPQPREVHVHRVLVPETVEDRIIALQDKKREVIGQALDERAGKSLARLGVSELKFLFGMN